MPRREICKGPWTQWYQRLRAPAAHCTYRHRCARLKRAHRCCYCLRVDRQPCVISSTWLWYLPNLQNRSEVPFLPPSMIIHSATAAKLLNNVIWCDSRCASRWLQIGRCVALLTCASVSVMRLCDDVRARKAMRARGERDDDYKENEKRVLKTNQFCATILSSLKKKKSPFKALPPMIPSCPKWWRNEKATEFNFF